jgi:hypothetical protein
VRRRMAGLQWLGIRLAFVALAIQAALPFLLAFEIRAYTVAAETSVIAGALCFHGGVAGPTNQAPDSDGNLAGCPLCATLAAMVSCGLPGHGGPAVALVAANAAPAFGDEAILPLLPAAHPYHSRAPPLV